MTYREIALRKAVTFVGTRERPPGSNCGPEIDKWNKAACGMTAVFWCMSFVNGMFRIAGILIPGGASVGNFLAAAKGNGWVVKRPRRGDIACFEFGSDHGFDDHVGIVERVLALRWGGGTFTGWVQTVEGNTSSGVAGSQDNGGGVYRRRRWLRGIDARFVRVPGRP